MSYEPQTCAGYMLQNQFRLRLPLTIYNTGARTLAVTDLQAVFQDEDVIVPIALVGLHTRDLPEVREDDRSAAFRLLANPRKELDDLRTQCVNRLHRDLVGLNSGGVPQALTAAKAKALLARVRPRDEIGQLRRRLAADQLADLVALDNKLAAVEAEIRALVKHTPTGLPSIYGVVITATIIGEVGDVARFRDRHQFASYNGTAPDAASAGWPVHCVNLKGNRRLNHAIHMAAVPWTRRQCANGPAPMVMRSAIAVGSRVTSWTPSPPGSRRFHTRAVSDSAFDVQISSVPTVGMALPSGAHACSMRYAFNALRLGCTGWAPVWPDRCRCGVRCSGVSG